jgi:hypothetical protein
MFGGTLALAFFGTLLVQSRAKWVLLRRIRRWPGVQATLDLLGRLWARWALRRLPSNPAEWWPDQPPPTPPDRDP